ncbi:hypothetical protein [Xylella fastidiosa]|nr:hypothetical protein [Xylella fastidiosa]WDN61703.1 hypothetical protein LOK86_07750 [Xylella fastidiosa subsp. multiplex]WDN62215.1 hypothetical protein LOK86_10680 [Xylella fastidiosa subsp. multiplex]WDN63602.1 hypothetical protein LOK81_05905 [Xylella fastidiosa subsp. multiplex]WDN64111.1 hypothetical protein LOK81_08840 [Xylella fastidiosa subsp. multiplex]WDN65707.1 hypothetical protein XYFPCFBP8416_005935 [Xylella fastidiosa subsp. multiplex]
MASHLGVWTTLLDAASDDRPGGLGRPMSAVKIIRPADPKTWKALAQRLHAMAQRCVVVGIPAAHNARTEDGIGSAGLLAVHELGAPERGIPERSVVRRSISEHQDNYVALHRQHLRAVLRDAMSVETALDTLGAVAAGDVQATIRHADLPPLRQQTIRRKGSSAPLIDTGQMLQSITYEVRDAED